jgi:uncharacterized protein (DUF1778 family)
MRNKNLENIQTYVKPEEKEIIEQACKVSSLNKSSFMRYIILREAKKILKEGEFK